MPAKIYIDGQAGTTALRIREWLAGRNDLQVVTLPEELRKNAAARQQALPEFRRIGLRLNLALDLVTLLSLLLQVRINLRSILEIKCDRGVDIAQSQQGVILDDLFGSRAVVESAHGSWTSSVVVPRTQPLTLTLRGDRLRSLE